MFHVTFNFIGNFSFNTEKFKQYFSQFLNLFLFGFFQIISLSFPVLKLFIYFSSIFVIYI